MFIKLNLIFQCPKFRKTRFKNQGQGKKPMMVVASSGQKERPGLGAETVSFSFVQCYYFILMLRIKYWSYICKEISENWVYHVKQFMKIF